MTTTITAEILEDVEFRLNNTDGFYHTLLGVQYQLCSITAMSENRFMLDLLDAPHANQWQILVDSATVSELYQELCEVTPCQCGDDCEGPCDCACHEDRREANALI